ncbi:MAG: hypothetical protein WCR72_18145 [Bacteroidota bacterium]
MFIEQHWLELLLFFISVNFKDIGLNVRKNFEYFDDLVDQIEMTLKDVAQDFPEIERDEILQILQWFAELTLDKKQRFLQLINNAGRVLKSIVRIVKHK